MLVPSTSSPTPLTASPTSSGPSSRGSHQLAAALTCQRLWYLRYHERLRVIGEPTYRLLGTLIHTCCAYHYAPMLKTPPRWYVAQPDMMAALEADGRGRPELIQEALASYEAYKHRYANEPLIPISVEEEYKATLGELCPLPNGVNDPLKDEPITCKTDLVATVNGEAWIYDHKTQSIDSRTGRLRRWKEDGEYALNWQILINLHVVRKRLHPTPVRGFVVRRISRNAPYDFADHPVPAPILAYEEAPTQMRRAVEMEMQIREQVARGEKPATALGIACWGRYGPCDYYDICRADTREQRQRILEMNFREG